MPEGGIWQPKHSATKAKQSKAKQSKAKQPAPVIVTIELLVVIAIEDFKEEVALCFLRQ